VGTFPSVNDEPPRAELGSPDNSERPEMADLFSRFPFFPGERGYRQRRCPSCERTLHRWLRRELPPKCPRAKALYPFELAIEIRVITETHPEAYFQNAFVCINQELRGSSDAEFVHIRSHGASGRPLEEAA
jgi:phage FluMu protein Com